MSAGCGRRVLSPLRGLWGAVALLGLALCVVLTTVPGSTAAFTAQVTNTGDTVGTNRYFTCQDAVRGDGAYFAHPLDDDPPNNQAPARDATLNNRPGTYRNAAAHSTLGVCPRDTSAGSTTFDGSTDYVTMPDAWTNPQTFTTEVWFRTTSAQGVLVGFSNSLLGLVSLNYDRHVYLASTGQLVFGVGSGNTTIVSPGTYTDGSWHQAVATLGSTGMRLYVDGALVASNTAVTAAQSYTGYWRFAAGPLTGWSPASGGSYFRGQLAWGAAYPTTLSASDVAVHYAAGR